MKKLLLPIAILGLAGSAFAQTAFTGTYTFTGTTGNTNSFAYNGSGIANLTIGNLVMGSGIGPSSSTGNMRATNWTTAASPALVIWDESVNGALSSSGNTPTALGLSLGSNTLISSIGGSAQIEYFSFTLAAGQSLTSFKLDGYVSTDVVAWLGIKSGSDWTIGYESYNRKSCSVEGKEKGGVSCCDWFTNSSPRWAERIRHHARFYGLRFELSIRSQARPETGSTGSDRDVSG